MPFKFTRKPEPGDIEPAKPLAEALPPTTVEWMIERAIHTDDYRCQICGDHLTATTQVHRRVWLEGCERQNYIHADARRCLLVLRRRIEAHEGGE